MNVLYICALGHFILIYFWLIFSLKTLKSPERGVFLISGIKGSWYRKRWSSSGLYYWRESGDGLVLSYGVLSDLCKDNAVTQSVRWSISCNKPLL